MTITRTFTRDELEELDIPWSEEHVVHTEQVGEKRWATIHEAVFRAEEDGPLWRVTYYLPATEMQECDLWEYDIPGAAKTVDAVQVEPYEATVVKYRPVEAAEERSDTTPMNLDPGEPADLTYRA